LGASRFLRIFLALVVAVLPAVALGIALAEIPRLAPENFSALAAVLFFLALALAWAAVLAVFYGRILRSDIESVVTLARRGRNRGAANEPTEGSEAVRRIAAALEERDRQVAALAAQSSTAPISGNARSTATHVTAAAREVTGDPTWSLAVMRTDNEALLQTGVYEGIDGEAPAPLGGLQQWASVSGDGDVRVHRAEGPWGAFVLVHLVNNDQMSAVLYAPWEGRPDPSSAQIDLLSLVGQHASTALEHAVLYAQVHAQSEAIDRMAEVQRDFLRGITHDLQTPLTSIRALASEVETTDGLSDAARADLSDIGYQADRLRRMVGQLLVVSRLEAGVLTPRQEILAVAPLVEQVWRALRADRPFRVEAEGEKQLAVADPDRVEQVLWAILDNAVKYSPDGSPITVQIRPAATDRLEVAVTDEGAGMDASSAAQAFEQFYRSPDAARLAADGSGIGLYAARGLIEAMGGAISLTSQLGVGTTVTCVLPAEQVERDEGAISEGPSA
jgi:signal transduction histidine kinase